MNSQPPLACLGGQPSFAQKLHVGRPNVGDRAMLLARINDMLDRRWLSNDGPFVHEFERKLADLVGVRHCVAMGNCTVALEIATRALGLAGEVIVPSFTFIATAHALQWQEITPVFADIREDTYTLDPQAVERMITPRTTGIIGVHIWGHPCDVEALAEIAQRHNLRLLFDAAHALGCSHNGRMIGHFGAAEVFSFHATKFCNSLEGGAVMTNDGDLAEKMRLMRNFGFAAIDKVLYLGTNGKMNEMEAAMGLTSLESIDHFVAINRRNYLAYQAGLEGLSGIRLVPYEERERCNYQNIVLEVDEGKTGLSRDELVAALWAENVIARRYFFPGCHRMEPYLSRYPDSRMNLPVTEKIAARVILLPTGTAMEPHQIRTVCGIIRTALVHATAVKECLPQMRGGSRGIAAEEEIGSGDALASMRALQHALSGER